MRTIISYSRIPSFVFERFILYNNIIYFSSYCINPNPQSFKPLIIKALKEMLFTEDKCFLIIANCQN